MEQVAANANRNVWVVHAADMTLIISVGVDASVLQQVEKLTLADGPFAPALSHAPISLPSGQNSSKNSW